jgi:hypothetical protein
MALNIATLLADYNGTALAVAGVAEWGFIPREWFIGIPRGCVIPVDFPAIGAPEGNPFRVGGWMESEHFIKANWKKLAATVPDPQTRLWVCMYRYHIASYGILCSSLVSRGVVEDEYEFIDHSGANWADAANAIAGVTEAQAKEISKHAKRYASMYMHSMVYVFSSRGHHWTPVYQDLYARLQEAQFLPANPGFALPSQEVIYRSAIHGFGIRGPLAATIYDRDHGNMAAAMRIRYEPHQPISGCAHITTSMAVIRYMQRESWFPVFATKFDAPIRAITDEVARIALAPTTFHVAAKVFGYPNRAVVSPNAMVGFNAINQFLLGYIDFLGARHSLHKQQAITNKAQGFGPLAEAFSRACDKFGKPSVDVAHMRAFLDSV